MEDRLICQIIPLVKYR